ncbi:hypothetical protein HNQ64_002186 [Prosthecobacter dejongeii]|uniref:Uncharacterized protein n=1 Tax=Prosthecobacter dejongeii TaxID=48465 RepID=A0A7W7YKJ9_9BACT|nr:hypothetical protein [Prosthecobacter dejongeii]
MTENGHSPCLLGPATWLIKTVHPTFNKPAFPPPKEQYLPSPVSLSLRTPLGADRGFSFLLKMAGRKFDEKDPEHPKRRACLS